MWVHQDQHQWKIYSEDPIMVKQVVSGCPEENKSEMKSNQVQPCSKIDIDIRSENRPRYDPAIDYHGLRCSLPPSEYANLEQRISGPSRKLREG